MADATSWLPIDTSPWYLVILAAIMLTVYVKTRYHGKVSLSNLPGPVRLPVLGNALWLDMANIHLQLANWARDYGGVFRMTFFSEDVVVLSSYMALQEALVQKGADFAGRPRMYRTEQAQRHTNSIVWQTYTPKLKFLRKQVHKYLKVCGSGLDRLEEKCLPEVKILLQKMGETVNRPFDPHDVLYPAISNVVICLLLGKRLDHSDPEFAKAMRLNTLFNDVFGSGSGRKLDFIPWFGFGRKRLKNKLEGALKMRDEFCRKHILSLQSDLDSVDDCIVKSLLQLQVSPDTDSGVIITDDIIKEVFTNILLAGTDTTVTALVCYLLMLVNYPGVQHKLQEETTRVINNRLPSLSDRQKMPYMEATLLELLRYISHVPLAVPHCTTQETEVQGYALPAGVTVYLNLWALHHDPEFWVEPWHFRPERFLDERGNLLSLESEERRRLFLFGAGRRVCLGETLAKNRLFLFAAALTNQYTFLPEVDGGSLPDADPRNFVMGLVIHPKPFKLRAISREMEYCSS